MPTISLKGLPPSATVVNVLLGARGEPWRQMGTPPGNSDSSVAVTNQQADVVIPDGGEALAWVIGPSGTLQVRQLKAPRVLSILASLNPSSATKDTGVVTVRVLSNLPSFSLSSELLLNGVRQPSKFVSFYELQFSLNTTGLTPGTLPVVVRNAGVNSNSLDLTIS